MVGISVCMIVKNEKEVLACCPACIAPFTNEIIVVDTGSTDKTKEAVVGFANKLCNFA